LFSLTKWTVTRLVQGDVILQVPVEPVRLLDQDRLAPVPVLLKELQHLAEPSPPGLARGLHVNEFLQDDDSVIAGIAPKQVQLSRDRVAFPFLFLAAHAGVVDGV
jgi:hypothetical protein